MRQLGVSPNRRSSRPRELRRRARTAGRLTKCRKCGDYYELPPLGHETYLGESDLCERCDGADMEAALAQLDRAESEEIFPFDSSNLALYAPDE